MSSNASSFNTGHENYDEQPGHGAVTGLESGVFMLQSAVLPPVPSTADWRWRHSD